MTPLLMSAIGEYSNSTEVGAKPGFTSIAIFAVWWVISVTARSATVGGTIAGNPSVGET